MSLKEFLNEIPKRTLVVLDEAYYEFVRKDKMFNTNGLLKLYPNLIVLRTFSKAFGLAGLSFGYGIMNDESSQKLNVVRGAIKMKKIAQEADIKVLEDNEYLYTTLYSN